MKEYIIRLIDTKIKIDISKLSDTERQFFDNLIRKYFVEDNFIPEARDFDFYLKYDPDLKKETKYYNNSQKVKSFGGAVYEEVKDSTKSKFLLCDESYVNGGHLLKVKENSISMKAFDRFEDKNSGGAIWIIRIVREIAMLDSIKKGFLPLHSSGVINNKEGTIFIGAKGSGKSTSLLTYVMQKGANPLSNDLIFLRRKAQSWEMYGWPLAITFGASLVEKVGLQGCKQLKNGKYSLLPGDFVEKTKKNWAIKGELKKIIFPKVIVSDTEYSIEKKSAYETEKMLQKYGVEDRWHFKDYLFDENTKLNYEILYQQLASEINAYSLKGNIWGK